jgi:hypothetical protein
LNRREVLGLATFAFTLLLAAIWVLTRFFSAFEFKSEFAKGPDFPIKGELLALTAADTYWREPVRAGEARDFARREVSLIPVLEITLDPTASSAGALLVIFQRGPAGRRFHPPLLRRGPLRCQRQRFHRFPRHRWLPLRRRFQRLPQRQG